MHLNIVDVFLKRVCYKTQNTPGAVNSQHKNIRKPHEQIQRYQEPKCVHHRYRLKLNQIIQKLLHQNIS